MRYGKLQNVWQNADRGPRHALAARRGVTLIEMLIVLFIISLLAVVALRALPNEDQRPREAARMLNVYVSTAKNNAAATGRPAGIVLRPWRDLQKYAPSAIPPTTYINYSILVEQCEVPEEYAGDTLNTQVLAHDWTLVPNSGGTPPPPVVPYCQDGRAVIKILVPGPIGFTDNLIRYGDQIQFNGQGPVYTICWDGTNGLYTAPPSEGGTLIVAKDTRGIPPPPPPAPLLPTAKTNKTWPDNYNFPDNPNGNGYLTFPLDSSSPDPAWINNYCLTCYLDPRNQTPLPWPKVIVSNSFYGPIPPCSFTIARQWQKSSPAPLQLPPGSGVDLTVSGTDFTTLGANNGLLFYDRYHLPMDPTPVPVPIVLMFSPSGSLDSLYIGSNQIRPTQPIHLVLGKLTVNSEPDNNWCDMRNIIVSINPQTGAVSTSPVYAPYFNTKNLGPPFANDPPAALVNQFNPDAPPQYDTTKPLTDPANAPFVQALFYSRKFARTAETMGGKR